MKTVPPGHSLGRDLAQVCQDVRLAIPAAGHTAVRAAIQTLRTSYLARGLVAIDHVALGLPKGADLSTRNGAANRALLTAQQLADIATAESDWASLKALLMAEFPGGISQEIIDILRA